MLPKTVFALLLLFILRASAFAQKVDTLDLQNPVDFYYHPGDTLRIHILNGLDSLSVSFDRAASSDCYFNKQLHEVKFVSGRNDKAEHLIYITSLTDTLNIINLYPVVHPSLATGFSRYNIAKILDESNYRQIKVDSTGKEKKLMLTGRKLVFEDKQDNIFYQYSYKPGLSTSGYKTVEITADTLVIRSRIHFPFSKLIVKARVLMIEYEGPLPAIDITPVKNTRKQLVEYHARGDDGINADTLAVFYDQLVRKPNAEAILFAANGGDGQDAPAGKHGVNYQALKPTATSFKIPLIGGDSQHCSSTAKASVSPDPSKADGLVKIDYLMSVYKKGGSAYHGSDWETTCVYSGSSNQYEVIFNNTTIKRAMPVPGGSPGEGGKAGVILSNHDIANYVQVKGGRPGQPDSIRNSGKITGPSRIWYLSASNNNNPEKEVRQYTELSYPRDSVFQPKLPVRSSGSDGEVRLVPDKPYLDFSYIAFTVDYALDLFRFGHVEESVKLLKYYQHDFFNDPKVRSRYAADPLFNELESKVNLGVNHMEANVDYYGNRYGFVPGLDIISNYAVYRASIPELTKTYASCLYLEKQITGDQANYQQAVKQINNYLLSNLNFEKEFEDIENKQIPYLEDKTEETLSYLEGVTTEVRRLEKLFEKRAKAKIRRDERRAKQKGLLKSITTLAKVIPVGQPYLGIGASVFEAFAMKEDGAGFVDQLSHVASDYGKIADSKKKFEAFSNKVSFALTTSPPDMPVYKKLYNNRDSLTKYIGPYIKSTEGLLAKMATKQVSKQSVAAEIAKLKEKHPTYKTLIDSVGKLTELNKELLDGLLTLQLKLRRIDEEIVTNSKLAEKINSGFSAVSIPEPERMASLKAVKAQTIDQINYYQYIYAKAYEYFTLKQYTGYENTFYYLKGDRIQSYTNYEALIKHVSDLYANDADQAPQDAFNLLNNNIGNVGYKTSLSTKLTKADIDKLNRGEVIDVNFFRNYKYNMLIGEQQKNEDFLVERIRLQPFFNRASSQYRSETYNYSTLSVTHAGVSKRYKEGEVYSFNHISKDGVPFYQWAFDQSFITGELTPREVDDTYLGLINVLTSGKITQARRLVSFDSDFTITKKDVNPDMKAMLLDSVKLTFDFVLLPRKDFHSVYVYDSSAGSPGIPFKIVSGQQVHQGENNLYHAFRKNSDIVLSAPEYWNNRKFSHWVVDGKVYSSDLLLKLRLNKKFYPVTPVYL